MSKTQSLELRAEPASVAIARHAAQHFFRQLGATEETLIAVAIAVTEAVANAVTHAYQDSPPGTVELEFAKNRRGGYVVVRDHGRGPQPNPRSEGAGFGLPLIASVSGAVEIRGELKRGTEVRMTFPL